MSAADADVLNDARRETLKTLSPHEKDSGAGGAGASVAVHPDAPKFSTRTPTLDFKLRAASARAFAYDELDAFTGPTQWPRHSSGPRSTQTAACQRSTKSKQPVSETTN
jgi:hypothetical protein